MHALKLDTWNSDPRSRLYQHKRALFTRELLRHRNGIVLDIGSGEGFILDALAKSSKLQYVAAELDKDLLKLAKGNMKNKHRVNLVCASVFHLPFRDNSFDVVMLLEVIEHLQNIEQLPRLINRIIKNEGMLVISTPYKEKIQYVKNTHYNKFTPLYGHLHSFDERKIQKLFNPYFNALRFQHIINPLAIMGPLLRLPFKITYFLNKIANKVFGKRGYWFVAEFKRFRVYNISTTEKPYYQRVDDPRLLLKHYMGLYRGDYQARRAHAITGCFPDLRGKVALDLGSGGGFYSLAALRQGAADVVLIDVSKVCINAARLNIKSRLGLKVDGIVADATKLPLRDRHFDFILCIDLVEHVKNDRSLIRESFRTLRATGFLLISTPNSSSVNYILESFIQRKILGNPSWMGWDPMHLRFYNPRRLLAMIRSQGFLPIKAAGTYFIPFILTCTFNLLSGKRFMKILYAMLMRVNDVLERRGDRAFLNFFGWDLILLSLKAT